MSIATFLWVLAFTSTEPPAPAPQELIATELEAELASSPSLYLVAALRDSTLAGHIRGARMFGHEAARIRLLVHARSAGRTVPVPQVVRTTSWALPRGLEFHDPTAPPGTPTKAPAAPASYRVFLDNGWQLVVLPRGSRLPEQALGTRLRDGWRTLLGHRPYRPPLLAVWLNADQARSLYHVFAPDLALLLVEHHTPRLELLAPPSPPSTAKRPSGR